MKFLSSLERFNKHPSAISALARVLRGQGAPPPRRFKIRRQFSKTGRVAYTTTRTNIAHGESLSILLSSPASLQEARRWVRWRGLRESIIGFASRSETDETAFLARGGVHQHGAFPSPESEYRSAEHLRGLSEKRKLFIC